ITQQLNRPLIYPGSLHLPSSRRLPIIHLIFIPVCTQSRPSSGPISKNINHILIILITCTTIILTTIPLFFFFFFFFFFFIIPPPHLHNHHPTRLRNTLNPHFLRHRD